MPCKCFSFKVPVLAKKTIKRTGQEKDGQVFIPAFRSGAISKGGIPCPAATGAHPISNAIGRQRILIPGQLACICGDTHQALAGVFPQPAVADPIYRNSASVDTKSTRQALRIVRGFFRQFKSCPAFPMSPVGNFKCCLRVLPNAIKADSQGLRYAWRRALTQLAIRHDGEVPPFLISAGADS